MTKRLEVRAWRFRCRGVPHSGWLPAGATIPATPDPREIIIDLTIERESGGFLLFWALLPESQPLANTELRSGDSWYEYLEDAFEDAQEWFGVPRQSWVEVAPTP